MPVVEYIEYHRGGHQEAAAANQRNLYLVEMRNFDVYMKRRGSHPHLKSLL